MRMSRLTAPTRSSGPAPPRSVELQARPCGIELHVEGRGLDCFLLLGGQAGERGGESVSDSEVHEVSFRVVRVDRFDDSGRPVDRMSGCRETFASAHRT